MNLKISLILLFLVALIYFLSQVQIKMEGFQSYNSDSDCPFIAR